MKRCVSFIVAAGLPFLGATFAGCAPRRIESTRPAHVVYFPGIGGADLFSLRFVDLINREVSGTSAQLWDWTVVEPLGRVMAVPNLQDHPRNRRRAALAARQLVDWRREHSRDKLYLCGLSGGAGIALFACERLPEDFGVERIVLISGAVSPDYDLTPALRKTRDGLYNYYSAADDVVLGAGTRSAGTMDRRFVESAGCRGFTAPADPAAARKLRQLVWGPAMLKDGNDGGHVGGLSPPFVRRHLLPLFSDALPIPDAWTCSLATGG